MKLSPKGFTLVELMIVIAIIGILAAALFPSLTSYLARGRDTSRAAGIKEISTGIAAFNVDKSTFPASWSGVDSTSTPAADCASATALVAYVPKFPKDPTNSANNCGIAGSYGYGTGSLSGTTTVLLSATFENLAGGNTASSVRTNFQGNNLSSTQVLLADTATKGDGSGYVIRN